MTFPLVPLLIDGVYGPGATGATIPVINPATEEQIADLAHAAPADLDRALAASARALRSGAKPRRPSAMLFWCGPPR
ncbi:hypothetical protein ACFSHQ_25215 [Gemmobacter lanyuensis]